MHQDATRNPSNEPCLRNPQAVSPKAQAPGEPYSTAPQRTLGLCTNLLQVIFIVYIGVVYFIIAKTAQAKLWVQVCGRENEKPSTQSLYPSAQRLIRGRLWGSRVCRKLLAFLSWSEHGGLLHPGNLWSARHRLRTSAGAFPVPTLTLNPKP